MVSYILILLVLLPFSNPNKLYKLYDYQAYYWRDFDGTIPSDAFSAGKNEDESVYIVQVLHKSLLIPGRLDKDLKRAIYEYDGKSWSTTENIKIFCSNFPHLFEWYEVKSSDFIYDKNYVTGGFEPNHDIFIGRGVWNGEMLTGKVVYDKGNNIYLHTVQGGSAVRLGSYEIMLFTPMFVNNLVIPDIMSTPSSLTNQLNSYDVYYWRDYKGTIPYDAFSAGKNILGTPIYIVQVLHKELLIPGFLDIDRKTAIYEYASKQWKSTDNFKILCTNYQQFLKWKKTDSCTISMTAQYVNGGYEPNNHVFIGKGIKNNQMVVGKIIAVNEDLPLLHTVQNGEAMRLKFYEALVIEISKATTTTARTILTNTLKTATTTTTLLPKTVVVTEGFDLTTIFNENVGNELVVSEHNEIQLNLNEDTKKIIREASISHSQNNDCNCTQRIYVININ